MFSLERTKTERVVVLLFPLLDIKNQSFVLPLIHLPIIMHPGSNTLNYFSFDHNKSLKTFLFQSLRINTTQ